MNKKRAIIIDSSALTDKNGNLNYFLLCLIDNLSMYNIAHDDIDQIKPPIPISAYCDLIFYAQNKEKFKKFAYKNCLGYDDIYSDDFEHILRHYKKTHKVIGMIVNNKRDLSFINRKFVQVLEVDQGFKHGKLK